MKKPTKKVVVKKTTVKKPIAKKPIAKKAQTGVQLNEVTLSAKPKPKPMYGGPEVRAAAKARRDSIVAANAAFSARRAAAQGKVDEQGNPTAAYWRGVSREAKKSDTDRYSGQLNKVNSSGEVVSEGKESPETSRKHCVAGKCAVNLLEASGALKNKKYGGKITKKKRS